jgi:predicted LPLAT superfamily acyltransferase
MAEAGWSTDRERGGKRSLLVMAQIIRLFGRPFARLLVHPASAFFFVFDAKGRRASRSYLDALYAWPGGREALGRPPGLLDVYRHIHEFAENIFDRIVLWLGGVERFDFDHSGSEHLFELAAAGRGGLLIGSHLGSFDMMRLLAGQHDLVVNVLMYTRHSARINAFFDSLDPDHRVRVIEIDPDPVRNAFEIRRCIERGEFVGILADRADPLGRTRSQSVSFLGRQTRLPLAPFLLATTLGCPALAAICVRVGDRRYEATIRPLGDSRVPRAEREKRARELQAAFVAELERYCCRAPYQWFNFYDYWEDGSGD